MTPSLLGSMRVAGVFEGFATIGILIALGILLAHLEMIDAAGQRTLSTLAFFVASPALLVTVLEDSDLAEVVLGQPGRRPQRRC